MEQLEKLDNGESLPLASAAKASSATPSSGVKGSSNRTPQRPDSVSDTKLSWEEQKRQEAERRKKEKEIFRLEKEIQELEDKKKELENKMADPSVYSNGEKAKAVQREIEEIAEKIEHATEKWMEISE